MTSNALQCPAVSDHHELYIITNISGERYQTSTNRITNMKCLDLIECIYDFKALPFSLVYSFDKPNEQLTIINILIIDCTDRHAPLVETKFKNSPAPWMRKLDIVKLQ